MFITPIILNSAKFFERNYFVARAYVNDFCIVKNRREEDVEKKDTDLYF